MATTASRALYCLAALFIAALLVHGIRCELASLEEEAARADNFLRGPYLDPSSRGRVEWRIPMSELVIEEGLVEVFLSGGVDGPLEEGESERTWALEIYTKGEDGIRYDAMIHPAGTEPSGPRTFSFVGLEKESYRVAPGALGYFTHGAQLFAEVEVREADPLLEGVRIQLHANPQTDHAAPAILGLARAWILGLYGTGFAALLLLSVPYFRASSSSRSSGGPSARAPVRPSAAD